MVAAAAGFAELQIGSDAPRFEFGGTDEARLSTAGPEAGLTLQVRVALGEGLELIIAIDASLAYLPSAPELVVPHAKLQPSASLTFGVGF